MKTELTIEESAKLIELGVDPELASRWVKYGERVFDGNPQPNPVFTLTDLLSILPKMIHGYHLNIDTTTDSYDVAYALWEDDEDWEAVIRDFFYEASAPELIDALYSLLIWAIEHNFVNTKDKKK